MRLVRLGALVPVVAATLVPTTGVAAPLVIGADGILCNLTETIAADQVDVECIVKPGSDPHSLRLRPSERQQLAEADLVLINGYSLTPALDDINTKATVIRVGEIAVPNHPGNDPHLWHDPQQVIAMGGVVSSKLQGVTEGSASSAISKRQKKVSAVLKDLDGWIKAQIATVPPQQHRCDPFGADSLLLGWIPHP